MKKLAVARMTGGLALLLAGCSRNIDNGDAVRAGVVDYLKARTAQTGLDINMMQVDVTAVSFQKDEAHATVYFRPKGTAANQGGMQMSYTLDRKGDKWVVRARSGGANPHGGAIPSGMSPPGSGDGTGLPPGHPSTGAAPSGELPPGHPSVGSKQ